MVTGDPSNLFSNLLVLYAMYLLSYNDYSEKLKEGFLKFTRGLVIIVGFICFIGWIDIITISEIDNQYYISISEDMRLGNKPILNVHTFFIILATKLALLSGLEWSVGVKDHDYEHDKHSKRERGVS